MTTTANGALPRTNPPLVPSTPAGAGRWVWPVDGEPAFSTQRVQAIQHRLHEHPLMRLPALADLAQALYPTKQCRFLGPGARPDSAFQHGDADTAGRTIEEVFARIEEPGSWVALYNVQTHAAYRTLLDEVVGSMRPLVEAQEGRILQVGGFVFISAPPSVTPFHIDRENNFWLQIRGRKVMHVWDAHDERVVAAKAREDFVVYGGLDAVRFEPGFAERSHVFDVGPGEGVYFPSTSPHMTRSDRAWVRPGDGVAVSIGVVFYTEATRRAANVHAWNQLLRNHFGRTPQAPGLSPWLDRLKYPLGRAFIRLRHRMRGHKLQVGF
ncbi:MAG: cupin [Betaproteobacteria bacterium]|nr:cupin [Betaproteobacteria bacterium]